MVRRFPPQAGLEPGTARSVGQRLTYGPHKNGWMICNFPSFSTVFQSYRDDWRMIMKGLCNGTPFTIEKISPRAGLELGTARSVGQRLTH